MLQDCIKNVLFFTKAWQSSYLGTLGRLDQIQIKTNRPLDQEVSWLWSAQLFLDVCNPQMGLLLQTERKLISDYFSYMNILLWTTYENIFSSIHMLSTLTKGLNSLELHGLSVTFVVVTKSDFSFQILLQNVSAQRWSLSDVKWDAMSNPEKKSAVKRHIL